MLQYTIEENDRWAPGELAQMAVEAGCLWISVSLPDKTDAELRDILQPDIIEMCREAGVILTVDDNVEVARELGLHGIRISRKYLESRLTSPMGLREELGPEAIIGIETDNPEDIKEKDFIPADIDFVLIPRDFTDEKTVSFVESVRKSGFAIPVVAWARSATEAVNRISDGCSGVTTGTPASGTEDPVGEISGFINAIKG